MKKGIGILTAALLTVSIYSQSDAKPPSDPTDLSGSASVQNNDDYRSRQTESGAPTSSNSGSASGYEQNSSSSSSSSSNSGSVSSDSSSAGPTTSTTTNPSFSAQSDSQSSGELKSQDPNNLGVAPDTTSDLSGGDADLRGDADLNSRFDHSNNGYDDLIKPDMIYEEWIVTEPSVGAPAQGESGSANSDERFDNDHQQRSDDNFDLRSSSDASKGGVRTDSLIDQDGQPRDRSDLRGTDIPNNSGAPGSVQSGSAKDSEMAPECLPNEGAPGESQTGYNEEGRDRSDDGVATSGEDYHVNRGQDNQYHINRSANSDNAQSSENSGSFNSGTTGTSSSDSSILNNSDSDYAKDLWQRTKDAHSQPLPPPGF